MGEPGGSGEMGRRVGEPRRSGDEERSTRRSRLHWRVPFGAVSRAMNTLVISDAKYAAAFRAHRGFNSLA